jgi:2-succinyl-6-hydroxy-2,4-cyclohexadiene-1-carboxylate synthase
VPAVEIGGLTFHVEERGNGDAIVLLHGFTGSSASWDSVSDRLAVEHRVVAIDLIGHGHSAAPRNMSRYEFATAIDDLAKIASRLDCARATWAGYSMGGRLALGLALQHPRLVSVLVLESASPGIASAVERSRRWDADNALAHRIEERGVPAFVAAWERLPLWESQRSLPASVRERQRAIRLGQRAVGLANSLRGMGQGAQPPLWERLPELRLPVLLLAGGRDEKYVDIARRMDDVLPSSTLRIVPDAGHAIHLEQPALYATLVMDFKRTGNRHVAQSQEGQIRWT